MRSIFFLKIEALDGHFYDFVAFAARESLQKENKVSFRAIAQIPREKHNKYKRYSAFAAFSRICYLLKNYLKFVAYFADFICIKLHILAILFP